MNDIDLLSGILSKTGDLVAGVRDDQLSAPTPCPEYDVETLRNHIVGWLGVFEAGCHGRTYEGDAAAHVCGDDPAGEFRATAAGLLEGWRTYGTDRKVAVTGGSELPAPMVLDMTLMEYLAHGWDLAVATGQPVPFTEEEGAAVLARAEGTLPPRYRGPGQAFGDVVPVAADAPAVDRFVAFMGRDPRAADVLGR
ncbi:TIGR03086 family metal-binding protein [uncultured Streptomyces sp.]|uniref:TIGR03086 family metal-binding protein n=1 Tax=uncultured Streptomyces sp. TaxID=174707 RepID=UPI00261608E9|nr:TIGR03086 family metal-binding protein [uncultured Streptomyces sp.]